MSAPLNLTGPVVTYLLGNAPSSQEHEKSEWNILIHGTRLLVWDSALAVLGSLNSEAKPPQWSKERHGLPPTLGPLE